MLKTSRKGGHDEAQNPDGFGGNLINVRARIHGPRALDCNNSFNAAKAALSKAEAVMKQMQAGGNKQLVHTLIDDAKMLLHSGIHNHEKPQGAFDHARAIAKARSAKGYAEAAEILAKAMK